MNKFLSAGIACLLLFGVNTMCLAQYTIYPVPQTTKYTDATVVLTPQVNAIIEQGIDSYTIDRLKEVFTKENGINVTISNKKKAGVSNIWLGIKGSKGAADKQMTANGLSTEVFDKAGKFDRHIVGIGASQKGTNIADIIIVGEHTNAVFYGLATIEQILEQIADNKQLKTTTIYDYADMQYRGIVEGYYGYPYSFEVKKDIMQFFKRYKMNTYLYGAKSDPYHSGFWRDPYPETITPIQQKNGWLSQQMIKDLSQLSLETKVNFIWAIHPNSGKSVDYHTKESTQKAVDDVMGKFDLMHQLGVRQFAVFLDDAGWDFDDVDNYRDFLTNLQANLENKYNKNYTNASDTVLPIHYVPHIYAINFARPNDLKTYFDAISQTSSNIVVYTTGSGVWSSLKNEDFVIMDKLMKRPVALWWNYPCNDNKDGRIYTSDMYSNLHEMGLPTPDKEIPQCLGMVSNPMQQGTVAKIGMFGVADYAWNSKAFDTKASWEASFPAIIGKNNAPLYNYLAKYLRYEDPKSLSDLINNYERNFAAGNYTDKAFCDTINAINRATTQMLNMKLNNESDQLLLQDLKPWLVKLHKMTETAYLLMQIPNIKDEQQKWAKYCEVTNTLHEFKTNPIYMVDALEGMGENPPSELHRVEPSHKYLMPFIERMVASVYDFKAPLAVTIPTVTKNGNPMTQTKGYNQDGTLFVECEEAVSLNAGESFVIELPQAGIPESATISPELCKKFNVSYSLYGKTFVPVKKSDDLKAQTIKYFQITNKSRKAQQLCMKRADLCVTMPTAPKAASVFIPRGQVWERHSGAMLVDGNYKTFTCLYRDQRDGDIYTVKLDKAQPIYDVTLAIGTTNLDMPKVAQIQVSADSTNWTTLKVEGTHIEDMRMSMPQVKKIDDNVSVCSFTSNGIIGQYVRFVLKESFQEKWLRLNEIDVNPKHLASQFVAPVTVNDNPVSEVTDGKASTAYTPETANETMIVNLFSLGSDSLLDIYAVGEGRASVSATNGTSTINLGTINKGVNTIDLTKLQGATNVILKLNNISISEIIRK